MLGMGAYFIVTLFDGRDVAEGHPGRVFKALRRDDPARKARRADRGARSRVLSRLARISRTRAPRARGISRESRPSGRAGRPLLRERSRKVAARAGGVLRSARRTRPRRRDEESGAARRPDRASYRSAPGRRRLCACVPRADGARIARAGRDPWHLALRRRPRTVQRDAQELRDAVRPGDDRRRVHRSARGALSAAICSPTRCCIAASIRSNSRRCSSPTRSECAATRSCRSSSARFTKWSRAESRRRAIRASNRSSRRCEPSSTPTIAAC